VLSGQRERRGAGCGQRDPGQHDRARPDAVRQPAREGAGQQAGVSKRTVYNYYGDKENLFLSVVAETYEELMSNVAEIADGALAGRADPEQGLLEFITRVAQAMARSPERAAMVRLLITESPHFPGLLQLWHGRRSLTPLLAPPLERLAAAGSLDIADPASAAAHLSALTFGQLNNRSLFGTVRLSAGEIEETIRGGVSVFLRAYRRAGQPAQERCP